MTDSNNLPNINTPEKPKTDNCNSIQLHAEESSSKMQSKSSTNEPKPKVQKFETTFTRTCNLRKIKTGYVPTTTSNATRNCNTTSNSSARNTTSSSNITQAGRSRGWTSDSLNPYEAIAPNLLKATKKGHRKAPLATEVNGAIASTWWKDSDIHPNDQRRLTLMFNQLTKSQASLNHNLDNSKAELAQLKSKFDNENLYNDKVISSQMKYELKNKKLENENANLKKELKQTQTEVANMGLDFNKERNKCVEMGKELDRLYKNLDKVTKERNAFLAARFAEERKYLADLAKNDAEHNAKYESLRKAAVKTEKKMVHYRTRYADFKAQYESSSR